MRRVFRPRVRRWVLATPVLALAGVAAITALITLAAPPPWLAWLSPWMAAVIAAVAGVAGAWLARTLEGVAAQQRGAVEPLRGHLGHQETLPRIGSPSARALALGVRRAIPLPESQDRVHSGFQRSAGFAERWWRRIRNVYGMGHGLDPDVPLFVSRDIGERVRDWMNAARMTGGFLLLVGDASVGKTRLLYETARKELADFFVLAPDPGRGEVVNSLGEATLSLPKSGLVVWLDELQRFLDGPYLAPGSTPISQTAVRHLLDAPTPVVVLGTLRLQYAFELRAAGRGLAGAPAGQQYPAAADILNAGLLEEMTLRTFSERERDLTVGLARADPRLADAFVNSDSDFSITEVLAGAREQMLRYDQATGDRKAVLNAAIDASRLGMSLLSEPVLAAVARGYLTAVHADNAWLTSTLAELVEPERPGHGPLVEILDKTRHVVVGYAVANYLLQHISVVRRCERLPEAAWQALIDHTSRSEDVARLALAADRRFLYCYAEPLYRRLNDRGDRYAARRLVDLIVRRGGPVEEAATVLRALIAAGESYEGKGMVNRDRYRSILTRLDGQGHHELTLALRREWADAGDQPAAKEWAKLLIARDDTDQAIPIVRTLVNIDEFYLAEAWVARLLIDQDQPDDAITVLRAFAEVGVTNAAKRTLRSRLTEHCRTRWVEPWPFGFGVKGRFVEGWFDRLVDQDRADEAMAVLRALVDGLGSVAAGLLANVLAKQGNIAELQERADAAKDLDHDSWEFEDRLVHLLAKQGEVEELEALANVGSWPAAVRLADLFIDRGAVEELTIRADTGDEASGKRLASLLVAQDDVDGLRARTKAGDKYAARALAGLLDEQGRTDEAITVLRPLAEAADFEARPSLAQLLRKQGNSEEALALLAAWADAGDIRAIDTWARLLIEDDRIDQAIPISRSLARLGEHHASHVIDVWCNRLTEQARIAEAMAILLAWANVGGSSSAIRLVQFRGKLVAEQVQTARATIVLLAWSNALYSQTENRLARLLLAKLLIEQHLKSRAIEVLQAWADAGQLKAAGSLVDLLVDQGLTDETIRILRAQTAAGDNDSHVTDQLSQLLAEHGHICELRVLADTADVNAASRLANVLAKEDNIDELRARTDANEWDWPAANQLCRLLIKQDRIDELRIRADQGDDTASDHLARHLAEHAYIDELRARADAGDIRAAWELTALLAADGRLDELWDEVDAGTTGARNQLIGVLERIGAKQQAALIANLGLNPDGTIHVSNSESQKRGSLHGGGLAVPKTQPVRYLSDND